MRHSEPLQEPSARYVAVTRPKRVPANPGIEVLCRYVQSHRQQRIALQEMQQISKMSARALQYAFMQRFGCSPMQWLRNVRLDWARTELQTQGKVTSIAELAVASGICKPSDFAMHYRRRFGELPSETLSTTLDQEIVRNRHFG